MIRESARRQTTPPDPGGADDITVRRVETLAEYEACVAIQDETWGEGFSERVPTAILLVAQKIGGVTAGAFDGSGRMIGFVFGLTGVRRGRLVHWSDMLAVREEARGRHLGERLKRYQRDLVRAVGVETMLWTYDPLVARNAHLNVNRLGAHPVEYVPDMYGSNTGSPLHGALPTDRLVVEWDLRDGASSGERRAASDEADRSSDDLPPDISSAALVDARRRAGSPGMEGIRPTLDAPLVNPPARDGGPAIGGLPDAPAVRIAIPRDLQAVADSSLTARWRATTREAFLAYLGRGYAVTRFVRATDGSLPYYELSKA